MIRGIICDLDGVVYTGRRACPGAVEALTDAAAAGVEVVFLTNNGGRTAVEAAEQLAALGVWATPDQVVTSAHVAADRVIELGLVPSGQVALAVGGRGVWTALRQAGVAVRTTAEAADLATRPTGLQNLGRVSVVVQGFGEQLGVPDLAEACYALHAGAFWLATNGDATIPNDRGLGPGNGALLSAVARATGRSPDLVVGKPDVAAFDVAVRRLGVDASDVLVIGDRLDTDIEGGRAAGLRTALVLTGINTRTEAAAAPPHQRPDHVVAHLPDLCHLWRRSS